MTIYQNVGFEPNRSSYVDVSNVAGPNTVAFTNKSVAVPTSVGATKMVSGAITVTQPFEVDCSEQCNGATLNESVKVQWNIRYANLARLTALRAEVNRVLDAAITDYHICEGLVPPVYASFPSE